MFIIPLTLKGHTPKSWVAAVLWNTAEYLNISLPFAPIVFGWATGLDGKPKPIPKSLIDRMVAIKEAGEAAKESQKQD